MLRQRFIEFFVLAAVASWLIGAQSLFGQSPENQIRRVLEEQVQAWNSGSIEGYMQGYWNSDETRFVSGGTMQKGWKNVLERYKKSYDSREKMGTLEFNELTIRLLSPSTAVANGVWKLHRAGDEPWGRFTLIVEKKKEGWRITHDHTSSADR